MVEAEGATAPPPPLLTPGQVADRLNITVDTVHRLRRAGQLPGIRLGYNLFRFEGIAVDRFLRERGAIDASH
jgi:excisionase family DNA binding protein